MIKRLLPILLALLLAMPAHAVLKEDSLVKTLSVLRAELTHYYEEMNSTSTFMKERQESVRQDLMEVTSKSNQNALMLYSQRPDYIFDLAYACHEATEQYAQFQKNVAPFRVFVDRNKYEISRFDSLIASLSQMYTPMLTEREAIDRTVCLTLAVNIRRTLKDNNDQLNQYISIYRGTSERLKYLNDYPNARYRDIQESIFRNGGDNYFQVIANLRASLRQTENAINVKYRPISHVNSQWDVRIILFLYGMLIMYGLLAFGANLLVLRYLLPKRFRTAAFMARRTCIILTTSVVTLSVILGILRIVFQHQNFILMASDLLVEYTWLLGVILISLLLRLDENQIKSGFRIYSPLIVMGFLVISFRIVLIPNDLVSLILPPIMLACAFWQWSVMGRQARNLPKSDIYLTYMTQAVFIGSVISSWIGYSLMSVQLLIWWIMQLSCILTITCLTQWLRQYAKKRGIDDMPVTKNWHYRLIEKVVLPTLSVLSIILSIYWAASIFNLNDTTWMIFNHNYIDTKNFSASLSSVCIVVILYFVFSYMNQTMKALAKLYFDKSDQGTAASRYMMVKNVLQTVVWGIWLLIALNIFHVSNTWLVVVSGGLSTGIGFAMKDILENIYYGISLMAGRVKIGDYIICDGIRGKVTSISYTSTLVEAIDGSVIAFTNSQLFTKNYKNMTKNHGYELDILEVGVAYGSDIAKVKQLLTDAINKLPCINKRRSAKIVLKEFGDSAITLKILVWVNVLTQYTDDGQVMECVYNTLNENGIEIPFPQRDIHIIRNVEHVDE